MTKERDERSAGPAEGRSERLARALRENLRRRKAQQRERGADAPRGPTPESDTGEPPGES